MLSIKDMQLCKKAILSLKKQRRIQLSKKKNLSRSLKKPRA
jgi:hypothetical protein